MREVYLHTLKNTATVGGVGRPLTKCSRLIRPIVSTTSIPRHPLASPSG